MNVISIGLLAMYSYELAIKGDYISITLNGVNVVNGQLINGVYVLSQPYVMNTVSKRPRFNDVSDVYLWHCRLGHINKNRMNLFAREGVLGLSDCELLTTCEYCLLGKMTK